MKTIMFTLFSILLMLTFNQNINAQSYVNTAATGSNDGTSWANAYTELHDALENYNAGDEIWVAAGTYLPQPPSGWPDSEKNTFYLYQDLTLYGGFNGTETTLADRDPETNITILSGDLSGDDIELDFETNRTDNAINVVFIEAIVSTATIIDGFTIKNGHAGGDDTFIYNQRGGGIWSYGSPQIRNCRFKENYAESYGGGLCLRNEASDEAVVEDCIFEGNISNYRGGGMRVRTSSTTNAVQVNNCQFIGNIAASSGGALYTYQASTNISNCQFFENNSEGSGGAIYILSNNDDIGLGTTIINSDFENNVSTFGGAFDFSSSGGENYNLSFNSCIFVGNEATNGGAFLVNYFGDNPQNNTISMEGCSLQGNTAQEFAGGVIISGSFGTGNLFEMNNCEIFDNTAENTGGIAFREGGINNSVLIRNTHFKANDASKAGSVGVTRDLLSGIGAPTGQRTEFINCLFTEHTTTLPGTVVAGTFGPDVEMDFINCTFTDNDMPNIGVDFGGEINLQNTILNSAATPNFIFGTTTMTGAVNSLGGNLISDNTLNTWLGSSDQSNVDPLFGVGTFQLTENSSGIDAGVMPDNVSEFDFDGNDRQQGGCIDIGAFESTFDNGSVCLTNAREVLVQSNTLTIFPNPVPYIANIQLENDWKGPLVLRVVNTLGQLVITQDIEKLKGAASWELDMNKLSSGVYQVLISDGKEMMASAVIKI